MAVEKFNLVLDHSRYLNPKLLHLAFKKEDGKPFEFIPGQFITFLLPTPEGQIKRRSYSISSIPNSTHQTDFIELAISYVPNGIASETLFNLKPGDVLSAMGPAGRLVMQEDGAKRYILIGTGTGIAPYRAMLPDLAQRMTRDPDFKVVMVLGAQYRPDLLYLDDFLNFAKTCSNFIFRAQLSREDLSHPESPKSYEYKGYVQTSFQTLNLDPASDVIFLCGNPNMIDESFIELKSMGFESQSIRREKYISSN